jgi:hypothetical protein
MDELMPVPALILSHSSKGTSAGLSADVASIYWP